MYNYVLSLCYCSLSQAHNEKRQMLNPQCSIHLKQDGGFSTRPASSHVAGIHGDPGDFRPLKIGRHFDCAAGIQHNFFTSRPNLVVEQ
jgi:hypothetical protein